MAAERNFATVAQRPKAQQRDLTQFDDPEVRARWCSDQWVVRSEETLCHIVVNCNIPVDKLVA